MKKVVFLILALTLLFGCIDKPDFVTEKEEEESLALSDVTFLAGFNFETSRKVDIDIRDTKRESSTYTISYELDGQTFVVGTYSQQEDGLQTQLILPSAVSDIQVTKRTETTNISENIQIDGSSISIESSAFESSVVGGCTDHLYAVNGNADFFSIDLMTGNYELTNLPQLPGGSIANALDQDNNIVYINIGKNLYAYDISTESFNIKHTSNPFNGSYPRLEYKDGFFYMSNSAKMYKVNTETNATVAEYDINGFINNNGGGDLAFDSNGDLYLACFSGLYKFTEINDSNGTAEIIRISAENFPFQLTSMAIDRQDRIYVGTNDNNSNLIQISKEDGAYQIVRTYDRKINDLTAWKCELTDLTQVDTDNDGVIDELDDYPNDPEVATDIFTPSELGMGSYAFEDLWPLLGDYDFNDMVVSYRYTNILNSTNQSVRFKMELVLKAVGAGERSGFGIELDVDPSKIESVTGHSTLGNNTVLDAKGLEAGQSKAVIIVFNDSRNHVEPSPGENFVNTDPSESIVPNVNFEVVIEFTEPIDPDEIGTAPFNPFIFASNQRGKEVHLSGKLPTSLADNNLFGTDDDDTNIGLGKTYQNENNLPWAIHIIHNFRYPIEKARINQGYNKFIDWSLSNGLSYTDWYGDNAGYRNTNKLYFNN